MGPRATVRDAMAHRECRCCEIWGPTAGLCEFVRGGAPRSQARLPASYANPWPADELVIGGHRFATVALSDSFR
jgi:hypothetical protein